jgi:hypothetical protein
MKLLSNNYAPIALFLFNRPGHTLQTLRALQANNLADESELYVFIDGPRSESDEHKIAEVKSIVRKCEGFRDVILVERVVNYGLTGNITAGVTSVLEKHGNVIVLEDDIVTSPAFLTYMNKALKKYEKQQQVWHISGFNDPVACDHLAGDTFFWRVMRCWGWATWRDRWNHYERKPSYLLSMFDNEMIRRFNLDDTQDYWSQVVANASGAAHTWAIFWYATIFLNDGLCLNPARSYIRNIGCDGSGVHRAFDDRLQNMKRLNRNYYSVLPARIAEDPRYVAFMKKYYCRTRVVGN